MKEVEVTRAFGVRSVELAGCHAEQPKLLRAGVRGAAQHGVRHEPGQSGLLADRQYAIRLNLKSELEFSASRWMQCLLASNSNI